MKMLLALLLSLPVLTASAQGLPADPTTGKVVYSGAVPVPVGVTPAQAFGRAKIWISDGFEKHEMIAEDAASGLLSGGGALLVKSTTYSFRVRLQVEPAAIRYRLDNFTWLYKSDGLINQGTAEEQRDSRLSIGKGARAKLLAELDSKVRASLAQLSQEVAGSL